MAQNEKEQNDYRITYYNTVSSKEVDWLWYPYIPYGKITILQGDPGEGKSTMMMQLAALITNGDAMPDGSGDRIPGTVIYQAAEDGIEDTIKPRLEAAGADCSRIAFLEQSDEEPILLNDVRLAQAIEGTKAKLLVIDPLQAYLGMDGEMQRSNSVRSVLGNLVKVAERTGCAVVLIGHMNKSNRAKGIYRGLGSIDIAAVARSILLVGRDRNVLTYLIHLGYLGYNQERRTAFVPNEEIRQELITAVESKSWNEMLIFQQTSEEILNATLDMDTEEVAD